MRVSIIVTTYNGSKYISEQLDSIKNQTHSIDEVIIYDDRSTDRTVDVIKEYISNNNRECVNWRLEINNTNLGWRHNFMQGITSAKGDVVFPCDQDDIWELDKVEKMLNVFEKNSNVMLLSCGYTTIDGEGKPRERKVIGDCNSLLQKVPFGEKFSYINRPGCAMAVKKEFVNVISRMWKAEYPHDAYMWCAAMLYNGCYFYNEYLLNYRIHDSNFSSSMNYNSKAQISALHRNVRLVDWYVKNNYVDKEKLGLLNNYLIFANLRVQLLEEKKVLNWFRLWKYKKYYSSIRQQFGDIYYLFVKGKDC